MTSAFFKKWVRVARTRLSGTSDNFADLILTTRAHHNVVGNDSRAGAPRATCWRLVAGTGEDARPPLPGRRGGKVPPLFKPIALTE